jgi:hypothetical protein
MRRGRKTHLRGVVTLPLSGNASGIYVYACSRENQRRRKR